MINSFTELLFIVNSYPMPPPPGTNRLSPPRSRVPAPY